MASCSAVVEEGLAAGDPWRGFCLVVERDASLRPASPARSPRSFPGWPNSPPTTIARCVCLLELARRAKEANSPRADFVLEDVSLALMANEGIRAESTEMRVAASRRSAALMLQSFQANPAPAPLPPAVRLPLSRHQNRRSRLRAGA